MSEWISVEDRLPTCDIRPKAYEHDPASTFRLSEQVLVCTWLQDGEPFFDVGQRYEGKPCALPVGWSLNTDQEGDEPGRCRVTHWIPIPEQPK